METVKMRAFHVGLVCAAAFVACGSGVANGPAGGCSHSPQCAREGGGRVAEV